MAEPKDWRRLARYVRDRRDDLGMTQEDVRAAGGPSTATMRLLEGALQESYQPVILQRLEKVLGWRRNSVQAVLAGGEPVLAEEAALAETPASDRRETRRLPILYSGVDEDRLRPYLDLVEAAVRIATPPDGRRPSGEEVWPDNPRYQQLWDTPLLGEGEKRRAIAINWMVAAEAARAG